MARTTQPGTANKMRAQKILSAYQQAVNKIDDYFEYRNISKQDKEFVYAVLASLSKELKRIDSQPGTANNRR